MKILLIIFFSALFFASCQDVLYPSFCYEEFRILHNLISECDATVEQIDYFKNLETNLCSMENPEVKLHERTVTCENNLKSMSCDKLLKIKTIDDFKKVDGCFESYVINKPDNDSACYFNLRAYCNKIFNSCGFDKVPDYCHKIGIVKIHETEELDFDKDKIHDYCKDIMNKNQRIEELNDLYYVNHECYNSSIDCNNIKEIDFRNYDWKNQCDE